MSRVASRRSVYSITDVQWSQGNTTLDTVTLARQERAKDNKVKRTMTLARLKQMKRNDTVMDSVTLARQEREKQGPWEVEVSYGGEADLHRHHDACEKNPGHQKFVPVDKFNVDHLFNVYNYGDKESLVDLVRTVSDLTVRVTVKYVSERRPETFSGSDKPYPCYRDRGNDMTRVGTGIVCRVQRYDSYENCKCKECQKSPTPEKHFARIYVNTAAHVVFDTDEGKRTTCDLFFDRGGTPDACSGVVTLSGASEVRSNIRQDWCTMTFMNHDLGLIERLENIWTRCKSLHSKLKICKTTSTFNNVKSPSQADTSLPQTVSDKQTSFCQTRSDVQTSFSQAGSDVQKSLPQPQFKTEMSSDLNKCYIKYSLPQTWCDIEMSLPQIGFSIETSLPKPGSLKVRSVQNLPQARCVKEILQLPGKSELGRSRFVRSDLAVPVQAAGHNLGRSLLLSTSVTERSLLLSTSVTERSPVTERSLKIEGTDIVSSLVSTWLDITSSMISAWLDIGNSMISVEAVRPSSFIRAKCGMSQVQLLVLPADCSVLEEAISEIGKLLLQARTEIEKSLLQARTDVEKSQLHAKTNIENRLLQAGSDIVMSLLQAEKDIENSVLEAGFLAQNVQPYMEKLLFQAGTDIKNSLLNAGSDIEIPLFQVESQREKPLLQAGPDVRKLQLQARINVGKPLCETETDMPLADMSLLQEEPGKQHELFLALDNIGESLCGAQCDIQSSLRQARKDSGIPEFQVEFQREQSLFQAGSDIVKSLLQAGSDIEKVLFQTLCDIKNTLLLEGCEIEDSLLHVRSYLEKMSCQGGTDKDRLLFRVGSKIERILSSTESLTIIVSHPHGCSKQVSVGQYINKYNDEGVHYRYTTPTCFGSSGAYVFVLGREWFEHNGFELTHCGNWEENKQLNYSGPGLY